MPVYPAPLEGKTVSVTDKVIIATSTTQSNGFDAGGAVRGAVIAPYTGNLTFQHSHDGVTGWVDVYNSAGTLTTIAMTISRSYPIPSEVFGARYVRCITPVQASDLNIPITLKAL
jgi:hypothetical protein